MPRAGGGERAPLVRASTAPKAAVSPAPPPAESQPAAPSGDYAAYPRRWWILFLLSSTSCLQSLVWMTFSPSKVQVQQLYGPSFTTAQIQLLAMWGPLGCLPLILFTAPIVRRLGLRAGVVLAAACVASGAALRSVTVAEPYALWLAHTAQILNAFAAPMVLATPPMLSATWFPPGERATATSIAVMANYGGSGLGFLLALPVATGHDFRLLLWGEASAAAVVLLLCLVDLRWPPTPPKPPSASAAVEVDMSSAVDVLKLLCEPQFTLLGVTYAVSQGIYSAWTGVLDPVLGPLGFSEVEVNWLGFAAIVGVVIGGIAFARVVDGGHAGSGRLRAVLLWLYGTAAVCFAAFLLVANRLVDFGDSHGAVSTAVLFSSVVIGSLTLNATSGIFYEAGVEAVFPASPTSVGAALVLLFNVFSSMYMLAGSVMDTHLGDVRAAHVSNWVLALVVAAAAASLLYGFKEQTRRTRIDDGESAADVRRDKRKRGPEYEAFAPLV